MNMLENCLRLFANYIVQATKTRILCQVKHWNSCFCLQLYCSVVLIIHHKWCFAWFLGTEAFEETKLFYLISSS